MSLASPSSHRYNSFIANSHNFDVSIPDGTPARNEHFSESDVYTTSTEAILASTYRHTHL